MSADLKIALTRSKPRAAWHNPDVGPRPTPLRKCLPIYVSRMGRYAHRVRSGEFRIERWRRTEESRITLDLWCGQTGRLTNGASRYAGDLHAVPPKGFPLCGTCEGRAVGAGYPAIAFLLQRYELMYAPREGRASDRQEASA